jgi:lipopolysaccharide export system protein LptC
MASKKSNTIILAVIAAAVIGILAFLVIENNKKTPLEQATDSVTEAVEDIGNAVSEQTGN